MLTLVAGVIGIVGLIYLTITPDKNEIIRTEETIEKYLLEEKSYNSSDIESITGNYNPMDIGNASISAYTADVVFKDEPEVTYSYFIYEKESKVSQGGINSPKDKNIHKEDHSE